jgi:hypothetical protein
MGLGKDYNLEMGYMLIGCVKISLRDSARFINPHARPSGHRQLLAQQKHGLVMFARRVTLKQGIGVVAVGASQLRLQSSIAADDWRL